MSIFSRVHATLQPALSVCLLVSLSVTLRFFATPARPHVTKVAVYPALLLAPVGKFLFYHAFHTF